MAFLRYPDASTGATRGIWGAGPDPKKRVKMGEGGILWIQMLVVVVLTTGLWVLESRIPWQGRDRTRTVVIGVLFGLIGVALLCLSINFQTTDAEVSEGSLLIGVRDMAPLAAGLFFDPVAGLIAGVICALFRMVMEMGFNAFWPDVLSLSLGAFLPGLISFLLGRYVLQREVPTPFACFATGIISEVLFALSLMETFSDSAETGKFMREALWSILLPTSIGMFLCALAIFLISGRGKEILRRQPLSDTPISTRFNRKLVTVILGVFAFTLFLTVLNQEYYAQNNAKDSLTSEAADLVSVLDQTPSSASAADLQAIAAQRHAGNDGPIFILKNGRTVSTNSTTVAIGSSLQEVGLDSEPDDQSFFTGTLGSVECKCYAVRHGDWLVLVGIPTEGINLELLLNLLTYFFYSVLLFAALYVGVDMLVGSLIVKSLRKVNGSLEKITNGDLDEKVTAEDSREFTSLSNDINSTVMTLKDYIAEAENRMNAELEFAQEIQHSALPSVVPQRKEFSLAAFMGTAKEVGGDFYDYFMLDDTHLTLVIADVSGKGIPAALFMMRSKTMVKNLAETGCGPAEILRQANDQLCEGNDAEMFVTAWIGIMDLASGVMTCSNAGHEYPAIMRRGSGYELLKDKHGMVLGGIQGARYVEYEIELKPGDRLFLYTDGVAEATDSSDQLLGTDRMLEALDQSRSMTAAEQLSCVMSRINAFVGDAPQFDDITMMSFIMNELDGTDEVSPLS